MRSIPRFPSDTLTVISWPDEVFDRIGHDARSRYVETYWLGILGPSATWLLRRMADELEVSPSGFKMDLADTARCLGIGSATRSSPFVRALGRLCQFELAQLEGTHILAVRRRVPSLAYRQLRRLSPQLQSAHAALQQRSSCQSRLIHNEINDQRV